MSDVPETPSDPDDPDTPIRGEMRRAGYRRVSHGLFLKDRPGLSDDEELNRDLRAWLAVLPPGAVFTHVTAARLMGWQLPALPDDVPVFAAVQGDVRRPRRPGLLCSRLVRETAPMSDEELPVDTPEEVLLRAARDLGVIDLVIMIDSALRLGHLKSSRMEDLLAQRRPGTRVLRAAWMRSNGLAESAGESLLRLFHAAIDVAVTPQVDLHAESGNFIGRADLLLTGTFLVSEYDGAGHREKSQHRNDLRRDRAWVGTPYRRSGYTLDDLLNHPGVVMHELDRLLERPHRSVRLARWRRLVRGSMYDRPARERVMNRWHRQMGVTDWSKTPTG